MQTFLKDCRWGRFLLIRGDLISQHADMYGEWAQTEVDLFSLLLPRDGVVIEVGSNIGMHAVPLSKICEDGLVYCHEPQRPIFNVLCANLALNNRLNVVARNVAVGAQAGTVEIETGDYEASWNYGSFSLAAGFSTESPFPGPVRRERVDVVALDTDARIAALPRIDLLKIDAEGFEPEVLQGARAMIARHRPAVFVEANNEAAMTAVLAEMRAHHYSGHWFVARRFRADNFNRVGLRADGWDANMLFLPAGRMAPGGPLREVTGFADLAAGEGVPILDAYA